MSKGTKLFGDRLSRVTLCPWICQGGPRGTVCTLVSNSFGTDCPGGPKVVGPFVQGDQLFFIGACSTRWPSIRGCSIGNEDSFKGRASRGLGDQSGVGL